MTNIEQEWLPGKPGRASQEALSEGHPLQQVGGLPRSIRPNLREAEVPYLQMIVHALKHPLSVLKGNLQCLQENLQDEQGEVDMATFTDTSHLCLRQVEQIDTLLNEALGTLPCRAPARAPGLGRVDVQRLVQEVVVFISQFCEGKAITVEECYETVPTIAGDREMLFHAFFNVVANALEAMPVGGKLKIRTACVPMAAEGQAGAGGGGTHTPTPNNSYRPARKEIVVEILDEGGGIEVTPLGKIFEPGFTTKLMGSGLGLSFVKAVMMQHDGRVVVRSTPEVGTTFLFYFPIADTPAQKIEEEARFARS